MRLDERREYWHALIEKQAESGLSGSAFCKEQGLNPHQFYSWRKRFHRESRNNSAFIRLVPSSETSQSGIRIRLGHGICVELDKGFDPVTLREVIGAFSARR